MTNDSEHTKENVIKDNVLRYILVFTPYHPYYHVAYYSYAPEKYAVKTACMRPYTENPDPRR